MTLPILFITLSPTILTTIAIFVAVTAVAWVTIGRVSGDDNRAEARLDTLRQRSSSSAIESQKEQKSKNDKIAQALERAAAPLKDKVGNNEKEMGKLRETMMNAGFRRETAPMIFKMLQLGVAIFGLICGGLFGVIADGFSQSMMIKLAIGGGVGYMLPKMLLDHLAKRRREKIFLGLPDALDLMVVCVEAGLGMDQALRKVAEEMDKSHKEIGEEFGIANQQLQFGRTKSEVLSALGYRSGVDDLKQLASILIQADKFGSSIATALRVQSDSMRTKRRQIAEEKAAKTAVKMIFPLVIFIFPGIFVVLVGPAGISMYRNMLSK